MNPEQNTQSAPSPTPVSQTPAPLLPPSARPNPERVIEPSAEVRQQLAAVGQQPSMQPASRVPVADTSSIYPEATHIPSPGAYTAPQQLALAAVKAQNDENNRAVSLRVKSLLILGIISALSALVDLYGSITVLGTGTIALVEVFISLVDLALSIYLLLGKDHHTVGLILKFYLVFQIIGILLSLANPTVFVIHGGYALFMVYVYFRVKGLSY